jgi:hypothetical protein
MSGNTSGRGTGYFLTVIEYLDEKGIDGAVGPYGINTQERKFGCKVKLNNIFPKMWEEVVKPFFEAEARSKGMIFDFKQVKENDDGFLSLIAWIRSENIVALGGPQKGVHRG